jgi:hypothetical protein
VTQSKSQDTKVAQHIHDSALALAKLAAASDFKRLTYLLSLAATEAAERVQAAVDKTTLQSPE